MRLKDYTVIATLLAAASVCLWRGLTPSHPTIQPALAATPVSLSRPKVVEQRIETIQVGQRVVGRNPIREEVEDWVPDAKTWKKLKLHMRKPSGASLWVTLLRRHEWLEDHEARVGGTVELALHEVGAVGPAEVTAIGPCPKIQAGDDHPVVTATFRHEVDQHSQVINLWLEGQCEPTGVTNNHLYWSVYRQDFIPAGDLRVGETLSTLNGLTRVVSVERREHTGFVYNLETTEHVFRVGALATLVHNASPIRHGTNRASADDMAQNGLNSDKARAAAGDGDFWATHNPDDAGFFARSNPVDNGADPAILRLDIDDKVMDSLRRQNLVEETGDWVRFKPEAFDILNEHGIFTVE